MEFYEVHYMTAFSKGEWDKPIPEGERMNRDRPSAATTRPDQELSIS
jgi:hypothetical protein